MVHQYKQLLPDDQPYLRVFELPRVFPETFPAFLACKRLLTGSATVERYCTTLVSYHVKLL